MLTLLVKTETEIPGSVFPRLTVEMALIRLTSLPPGQDVASLIRKLEDLERRLATGGEVTTTQAPIVNRPATPPVTRAAPVEEPPIPPEPPEPSAKKPEAPTVEIQQDKNWKLILITSVSAETVKIY